MTGGRRLLRAHQAGKDGDRCMGARSGQGFTILEMLVVLVIIGLVAAVIIPRTGVLDGVELASSARNMVGTIRLTYSRAAISRMPHRIVFDLDEHSYWAEEKSGEEYAPSSEPMLDKRVLPGNVYLEEVRVVDRECGGSGCRIELYFTPGGYVEEASIYLVTENGDRTMSILTRSMTGKSVILPGKVTREEWENEQGLGRDED